MLTVRIIAVGSLKEAYLREAVAEYRKRLGGFCRVEEVSIKESRLPDNPSAQEIASALHEEGRQILSAMPPRAYRIAMCVEGKQLSSEQLAKKLETASQTASEVDFVIGSSFGLSDEVKAAADLRLSVSALTFPHQLMRVILYEAVYRAMNIQRGTRYHK